MSETWKTILFARLARFAGPSGVIPRTGPYKAIKLSAKKATSGASDRIAIKVDLRIHEPDRAAIGVTLSLANWNWLLDAMEASENHFSSLERETGMLYVTKNEDNECLVYTEDSCRIFGIALSKAEVEGLLAFRQAFTQLFTIARNVNEAHLKEMSLAMYANFLYTEGCSRLKDLCAACALDDDMQEVLKRQHSCIESCKREEDFPMNVFLDPANMPCLEMKVDTRLVRLQKKIGIPEWCITSVRQGYIPQMKDSPLLKDRILLNHKKMDKLGELISMVVEKQDSEPVSGPFNGRKRRRPNYDE